jgi:hypothetical protein
MAEAVAPARSVAQTVAEAVAKAMTACEILFVIVRTPSSFVLLS